MKRNLFNKNKIFSFVIALVTVLFCGIFAVQGSSLCLAQGGEEKVSSNAEIFMDASVTDSYFTMKMEAVPRKLSTTLYKDVREIESVAGIKANYYCFKWRDLEYLKFKLTGTNLTEKNYLSTKLVLSNIQSNTIDSAIGVEREEIILTADVRSGYYAPTEFYYYIDSDIDLAESLYQIKGNDFGLYKFDFIYTYLEKGEQVDVSVGDISVAVIPDRVDEILETNTKIEYEIKSSNRLMNTYKLKLSTDEYKYVNPKYLEWVILGENLEKTSYILTKQQKERELGKYANYKYIWDDLDSVNGKEFIFDSNDIEGNWTAYLKISNEDLSEHKTLVLENLSTVKQQKKTNFWWIIILIGSCLLLVLSISLIIARHKKDKVW